MALHGRALLSANNNTETAARHLINRFGDDAIRQAKIRATELRDNGEAEGYALWLQISEAVELMLAEKTSSD